MKKMQISGYILFLPVITDTYGDYVGFVAACFSCLACYLLKYTKDLTAYADRYGEGD